MSEMLLRMFIDIHVQFPLFLSDFNEICTFPTDFFSKNTQISNLIKICPVEAEFFLSGQRHRRKDRQT